MNNTIKNVKISCAQGIHYIDQASCQITHISCVGQGCYAIEYALAHTPYICMKDSPDTVKSNKNINTYNTKEYAMKKIQHHKNNTSPQDTSMQLSEFLQGCELTEDQKALFKMDLDTITTGYYKDNGDLYGGGHQNSMF